MTLRETSQPLGAPWSRPLQGSFEALAVESELLAGNPLGDPARRPLYVYSAPGAGPQAPLVLLLQGYSNQLDTWLARRAFEPTVVERLDSMFTATPDCPPVRIAFVDAWTSRGGSQFIDSTANGPYGSYICDEIVPFLEARYGPAAARAVLGGSSGGYGAMVLPMLRPDVFGAFGAIAGDGLFECSLARAFPAVARQLRDSFEGSYERLLAELTEIDTFDWGRFGQPLEIYAYACAYSPDPAAPGRAQLPFDLATGRVIPAVWERWLEHDPVRMVARHADALRSLRAIHLYAGRDDEYFLDLAASAFAAELDALDIAYSLELYPGGHGTIRTQYPRAVAALARTLAT